jgi:threonine synthase
MAHLFCIAGCSGEHDVFTPLFSCPTCGGLVDVAHDVEQLARTDANTWKKRISERASSSSSELARSGVWMFREWVMPGLADDEIITLGEGRSPLTDVPALSAALGVSRLAVKHCGQSPTGSFKDLGMTVLVSMANAMQKRGRDVRVLLCASTGDTSAALAAYGARAGLPVVVLLPAGKISTAQLVQPVANGAHVFALDGDFDRCMAIVKALEGEPGVFLANSKNPLRLEGQKTVAFEIVRDRGYTVPDAVVVPSGNLGNVGALFAGFKLMMSLGITDRMPRLVAAQVDAANPLYRSFERGLVDVVPMQAQRTLASAIQIGAPVSFPRAKKALSESNGLVSSVSESELLDAMTKADRAGLFVCPHTAAALAGVEKLVRAQKLRADDDIVVVSTAHGLKFVEQKVAFHDGVMPLDDDTLRARRNPPLTLAADLDVVRRALADRVLQSASTVRA